jgi:sulfotransferase
LAHDQVVGLAYSRLRDVIQRGLSDRLHIVEFDDLTNRPQETLEAIYSFLELDSFPHDFENVDQYTHEDDSVHGMDLHTIRKSVKLVKDDSLEILGEEVVKQFSNVEFWRK